MEIIWDKNFVYFLGFLWADGFIERKRSCLGILKDDADVILHSIKKIKFLNICTMERYRKNRKPQKTIYFCNVKFYDEFLGKYFIEKSIRSPIKLLEIIPKDFKRYFYLGLIDGDGCFYLSKDNKVRQFYVTSAYEQDWSHIVELFNELSIKRYEIRKVITNKGHKYSTIRIKKVDEICKLYNYLYLNGYEIGLKRKFDKCYKIANFKIKSNNTYKISLEDFLVNIKKYPNIHILSKIYECNWRKLHNFCKKHNINKPKKFYADPDRKDIIHLKRRKTFLSYEQSSLYVQEFLKVKSKSEYHKLKESRPYDIPSNPNVIYKNKGWISWSDWLGYKKK